MIHVATTFLAEPLLCGIEGAFPSNINVFQSLGQNKIVVQDLL